MKKIHLVLPFGFRQNFNGRTRHPHQNADTYLGSYVVVYHEWFYCHLDEKIIKKITFFIKKTNENKIMCKGGGAKPRSSALGVPKPPQGPWEWLSHLIPAGLGWPNPPSKILFLVISPQKNKIKK
jgi:hypothetical protein